MMYFAAKDFFWIDRVNGIFVLKGQVFAVPHPSDLPVPTISDNALHYYKQIGSK